jgi:hypothetical protein
MNRRAFSAFAAALLLSAFAGTAAQAQLSPQWANGIWQIQAAGKEFHSGFLCMSMQQYNVVGRTLPPSGNAMNSTGAMRTVAFRGKLTNNKLSGNWTASPGGDTGWLTVTFGGTFRTFSGEYGQAGKKPMGNITGTFAKASSC